MIVQLPTCLALNALLIAIPDFARASASQSDKILMPNLNLTLYLLGWATCFLQTPIMEEDDTSRRLGGLGDLTEDGDLETLVCILNPQPNPVAPHFYCPAFLRPPPLLVPCTSTPTHCCSPTATLDATNGLKILLCQVIVVCFVYVGGGRGVVNFTHGVDSVGTQY